MMKKLASSPVPIAITGVASPVFGVDVVFGVAVEVGVGVVGVATGGVVGVFSSVIVTKKESFLLSIDWGMYWFSNEISQLVNGSNIDGNVQKSIPGS